LGVGIASHSVGEVGDLIAVVLETVEGGPVAGGAGVEFRGDHGDGESGVEVGGAIENFIDVAEAEELKNFVEHDNAVRDGWEDTLSGAGKSMEVFVGKGQLVGRQGDLTVDEAGELGNFFSFGLDDGDIFVEVVGEDSEEEVVGEGAGAGVSVSSEGDRG
jgi:hypothetical protein